MRTILEMCLGIDETALTLYRQMAKETVDPALADVFRRMAVDETRHVAWWKGLIDAYDRGAVPIIVEDPVSLNRHLRSVVDELKETVPPDTHSLSDEEMLAVAAKVEFFALEPAIDELMDLATPGAAKPLRHDYEEHIQRLIDALESHMGDDALAAFLARILRRSWQNNRTLLAHAMRDPLTGLHNRRALTAQILQWTAWAARYGKPLALLAIDIDDFKRVNDAHGHQAGDRTLVYIAEVIRREVRASDLVARIGGDEFVVLAPETSVGEATAMAERMLSGVRDCALAGDNGQDFTTSLSIGLAIVNDPPGSKPRSLDEILAMADMQMYAAKRAGKDHLASPIILSGEAVIT